MAIALGLGRTSRVRTQPDLFAKRGEKSGIERETAHVSCLQGKDMFTAQLAVYHRVCALLSILFLPKEHGRQKK